MKKLLFILILMIVISTKFSFAQKGFHAGLGMNYNTVWIINQNSYGLDEYDYALDMGSALRFDVGYNFTDHLGLQTGFTSFKSGQKYDESHGADLHREIKMHYTGVPFQFVFVGGKSTVKFYAAAGPQFSFLGSASLNGNYYGAGNSATIEAKERFEKSNTGLNFGLGANISITEFLYINAGMSFLYGFSDINAESGTGAQAFGGTTWRWPSHNTNTYEASNLANGGFSIGIHYLMSTAK